MNDHQRAQARRAGKPAGYADGGLISGLFGKKVEKTPEQLRQELSDRVAKDRAKEDAAKRTQDAVGKQPAGGVGARLNEMRDERERAAGAK